MMKFYKNDDEQSINLCFSLNGSCKSPKVFNASNGAKNL